MEDLLLKLGNPGRYQTLICLLLGFNFFQITFNNLCMTFYGADADFLRCDNFNDFNVSSTAEYSVNTSKLYADRDTGCWLFDARRGEQRDRWCDIRDYCTTCNQTTHYVTMDNDWSVVSEFDLMCDRAYLSTLSSSGFFFGAMLGGVFWGHVADRWGRFPALVITLYVPVAIGFGIFLAQSFLVFAVLRFVMGFCIQGLHLATVSLVLEYFNARQRRFAVATLMLFWGIGVFGLATIAFLVRHWRWMQLVSASLTVLSVSYIWLIPESLRWLILKRKYDRARKLIRKIMKYNKIPKDLQNELNNCKLEQYSGEKQTGYNISHLLRHKGSLLKSCILWYLWLALSLGYFGLALSTGTLHGSKYVNFYIGSAAEIGAYVLPFICPERFGRRRPLFLCFVVGGIACVAAGNVNDSTWKTALALVGRFGISGVYPVLWTFTPELYPTLLRTAGLGSCTFWAGVGGILAPQINLLGVITFPSLPITLFGIVSTIAAFLVLLLPETRKRKIPDTLEEAKDLGWGCWGNKRKTNELLAIEVNPPSESKNFL